MIENNNRKKGDIKEICGTILLHWHSILTQDSEFGKIFIKYLKVVKIFLSAQSGLISLHLLSDL